jgi:hypothetical protein
MPAVTGAFKTSHPQQLSRFRIKFGPTQAGPNQGETGEKNYRLRPPRRLRLRLRAMRLSYGQQQQQQLE